MPDALRRWFGSLSVFRLAAARSGCCGGLAKVLSLRRSSLLVDKAVLTAAFAAIA